MVAIEDHAAADVALNEGTEEAVLVSLGFWVFGIGCAQNTTEESPKIIGHNMRCLLRSPGMSRCKSVGEFST